MNGKKARAQRHAAKRSSVATRSRLARKASRIDENEAERAFDVELGALKRKRDELIRVAKLEREQAVLEANRTLAVTRKQADKDFDEARNALVKKYAGEEAKAA